MMTKRCERRSSEAYELIWLRYSRGCGRAQPDRGAPREPVGFDLDVETVGEIDRAKVAGTGHSKGMIMRIMTGRRLRRGRTRRDRKCLRRGVPNGHETRYVQIWPC